MMINIFTYLTGYSHKIYERFSGSLFDTGFDGKLYLFVHKKDLLTLSQLDQALVDKISVVECPDYMQSNSQGSDTSNADENEIHPQNFRYLLYLGFLQQNKQPANEYSFFCDSRDLLFQKNPNDYTIDSDIDMLVFQEDTIIENCPFNSGFLNSVKSKIPDGTYTYASNKAICSGTIIVKNKSLHSFIATFCRYMMETGLNTIPMMDQGLHNYLLYNNLYDCNYKIMTNDDNFIKTVGTMDYSKIQTDNAQIVDLNGIVPYMVHQYDRLNMDTLEKISSKYDFTLW